MADLVWVQSAFGNLVWRVQELLRPVAVDVVVDPPADAPDLIIRDWAPGDPARDEGTRWRDAPPPAQLYLIPQEYLTQVLADPIVDPFAELVLLPTRAADVALAVTRALARRDRYMNLGQELGTAKAGEPEGGLVGQSAALKGAIALARQVACSPVTSVLIQGESGTGKDLLARLIHALSAGRRHRSFIDLNCAAIPSDLLEAELFGFERGAFTHAGRDKPGLMELAHGGTLFLDEVGELNVGLQAKLLRVLETGTFRRLGGVTERRSECRVVASTNRNLLDAVQQGLFRLDLYHRLAVLTIHTPALRDRREDIMPMACVFLDKFRVAMKKSISGFSPTAQALLMGYPYPGNVRELRNIVERAVIVTSGPMIVPKDLGLELALMADTAPPPARPPAPPSRPQATLRDAIAQAPDSAHRPWDHSLEDAERRQVEQVLAAVHGNRAQAARLLQISLPTLYKKMRKYRLEQVGR